MCINNNNNNNNIDCLYLQVNSVNERVRRYSGRMGDCITLSFAMPLTSWPLINGGRNVTDCLHWRAVRLRGQGTKRFSVAVGGSRARTRSTLVSPGARTGELLSTPGGAITNLFGVYHFYNNITDTHRKRCVVPRYVRVYLLNSRAFVRLSAVSSTGNDEKKKKGKKL